MADLRPLYKDLVALRHNPLAFVLWAFPWGVGELEGHDGPDEWQRDVLREIGAALEVGGDEGAIIQQAIASGHGVGKSCLVAWLILWAISTKVDTKGVVTANTENQLKTKTWAELAKWHRQFRAKALFTLTATALYSADPSHEKTWRVDQIPWSANSTESFAGLHNKGRRILLLFDEGSAIPDVVWEVSEGALTDTGTEIIWAVFGNPTRNTGRFRECFGRYRHRWTTRQIDSRSVKITNKAQIEQWAQDYGDDSDFFRVRVRGEFPRAGSTQLISGEIVEAAVARKVTVPFGSPKLMGVDVARFGDDSTVIARRHGRKLEELIRYRGLDTMQVAAMAAEAINKFNPDAVFVDEVGLGAGVVDRLAQLGHTIIAVNAGKPADDDKLYYNKRAEMWRRMATWLEGADIPDDRELIADLIGPEYGYDNKMRVQLEKKEDMKKRGLASPDAGDALAQTFAYATPPVVVTGPGAPMLVPDVFYDT